LDTLLGRTESGRDYVIQQGTSIQSIRHGDWKYVPPGQVRDRAGVDRFVMTPIPATGALYFLPEDPEEQRNVASLYPAKARQLREILEAELGRSATQTPQNDSVGGAVQR
jgi:arylsulfatase A-like enzyme